MGNPHAYNNGDPQLYSAPRSHHSTVLASETTSNRLTDTADDFSPTDTALGLHDLPGHHAFGFFIRALGRAGHVSKGSPMNRRRLDPPPTIQRPPRCLTGSHTPRHLACFMVPQEPAPVAIKRTIRLFATTSTPATAPSPAPPPTCGPLCTKAFSFRPCHLHVKP